jgi:hypothetical protein
MLRHPLRATSECYLPSSYRCTIFYDTRPLCGSDDSGSITSAGLSCNILCTLCPRLDRSDESVKESGSSQLVAKDKKQRTNATSTKVTLFMHANSVLSTDIAPGPSSVARHACISNLCLHSAHSRTDCRAASTSECLSQHVQQHIIDVLCTFTVAAI